MAPHAPKRLDVALDLVDDPALPSRTEMDDRGLESLAASIRDVGLIEPVWLKPVDGGRYQVVAGHRRTLAARMAGKTRIAAFVTDDEQHAAAVQLHENVEREELHPLDEAVWLRELYERNGRDLDRVAELVKRGVEYVSRRLLLLNVPAAALAAYRRNEISLGVAEELGHMTKPADVEWYLGHAIRGGCSVAQMRRWRIEANARAEYEAEHPDASPEALAAAGSAATQTASGPSYLGLATPDELSTSTELRECFGCRDHFEEWRGIRKFFCRSCADRMFVPLLLQEAEHAKGSVKTGEGKQ